MPVKLIDSHCHVDSEQFNDDRDAVIERALAAGVEHMVAIGSGDGPPDLEAGIRLADRYPAFYATVGVHPHDAAKANAETYHRLAELAAHPKVVAIGEIGLDYHYDHSPREVQRDVFAEQMRIARDARKPISIHTRTAWEDTIALLREYWAPAHVSEPGIGGIMHCFSEGPSEAEQALALGFYISFAGIVTFPKATAIQEAARMVPADRLLIETDAPYLAPVPKRGKRNEPAYVVETARKLAELRGVTLEEIAQTTADNFRRLCLQDARLS
jgi:TatD DNase family protein